MLKKGDLVIYIEGKHKGELGLFLRYVDYGNLLFYSMCSIFHRGSIRRYNTSLISKVS